MEECSVGDIVASTAAFQKMEELEKKQLSFFKAMIKSYCTGIINIPHSSAKIISLTRSWLYYPEEISLSLIIYSSCFLYFGMLYFVHYFITIITGLLVIVLTYMDCPGVTSIMNEWILCFKCVSLSFLKISEYLIISSLREDWTLFSPWRLQISGLYSSRLVGRLQELL